MLYARSAYKCCAGVRLASVVHTLTWLMDSPHVLRQSFVSAFIHPLLNSPVASRPTNPPTNQPINQQTASQLMQRLIHQAIHHCRQSEFLICGREEHLRLQGLRCSALAGKLRLARMCSVRCARWSSFYYCSSSPVALFACCS